MDIFGFAVSPEIILFSAFVIGIPFVIGMISLKYSIKATNETMQNLAKEFNFRKTGETELKGIYGNKEMIINRGSFVGGESNFPSVNIETTFSDESEPKIITTPYFSLSRKIFHIKWNGFDNSFNITGNVAPSFDGETRSRLESLFEYFDQFTNLSAWPPNRGQAHKAGKVSFELPWEVTKDLDSLRTAMDVVVRVADYMPGIIRR